METDMIHLDAEGRTVAHPLPQDVLLLVDVPARHRLLTDPRLLIARGLRRSAAPRLLESDRLALVHRLNSVLDPGRCRAVVSVRRVHDLEASLLPRKLAPRLATPTLKTTHPTVADRHPETTRLTTGQATVKSSTLATMRKNRPPNLDVEIMTRKGFACVVTCVRTTMAMTLLLLMMYV